MITNVLIVDESRPTPLQLKVTLLFLSGEDMHWEVTDARLPAIQGEGNSSG
jgi:hypothetical protein